MATELFFPQENSQRFNSLNAYLRIRMKTLNPKAKEFSTLFNQLKNVYDSLGDWAGNNVSKLLDSITKETSKENNVTKTIENALTSLQKTKSESILGRKGLQGDEIFVFNTYIPNDFAISLIGDWQTTELISTANIAKGVIDSALGVVKGVSGGLLGSTADLISNSYTTLKNQLQYINNAGLSPLEVKLFQPSFLDTGITFEFIPHSSQEADDILKVLSVFQQAQIPKSKDGEWFDYTALFDIELVVKENNGREKFISNKSNQTIDMFTYFKDLGLTSFNISPITSNNIDLKMKADGSFPGYRVTMNFTTVRKVMDRTDSVETRVKNILG